MQGPLKVQPFNLKIAFYYIEMLIGIWMIVVPYINVVLW